MDKKTAGKNSTVKITISEKRMREIISEELAAVIKEAGKSVITEDMQTEDEQKKSHEISAAASTLHDAIESFEGEDLPDVPSELASALQSAKSVLANMADSPGQYKGGAPVADSGAPVEGERF